MVATVIDPSYGFSEIDKRYRVSGSIYLISKNRIGFTSILIEKDIIFSLRRDSTWREFRNKGKRPPYLRLGEFIKVTKTSKTVTDSIWGKWKKETVSKLVEDFNIETYYESKLTEETKRELLTGIETNT